MSRIVVQVARREEARATAIVEFGPGQPVRYGEGDGVLSDVLKLERPLPLAVLVRHVLTRYGLEPKLPTDCDASATVEAECGEPERGCLRA